MVRVPPSKKNAPGLPRWGRAVARLVGASGPNRRNSGLRMPAMGHEGRAEGTTDEAEAETKNKIGAERANGAFALPAPADPQFFDVMGGTRTPRSHRPRQRSKVRVCPDFRIRQREEGPRALNCVG